VVTKKYENENDAGKLMIETKIPAKKEAILIKKTASEVVSLTCF